jgi:hypothetical protein
MKRRFLKETARHFTTLAGQVKVAVLGLLIVADITATLAVCRSFQKYNKIEMSFEAIAVYLFLIMSGWAVIVLVHDFIYLPFASWIDKKEEERALKAVTKMTDQQELARVAKEASNAYVLRIAAVKKLTDQAVLADIAKNAEDSWLRLAAVANLTDQAVLADVAKNHTEWYTGCKAVAKLTDQDMLVDVAKNGKIYYVRKEAVKKVTNQDILAFIAKSDKHEDVREAARVKLTVRATLAGTPSAEPEPRKNSAGAESEKPYE